MVFTIIQLVSFNTQPPEGGCWALEEEKKLELQVSTHSRPKAAAWGFFKITESQYSFNTQPPEGGCIIEDGVPRKKNVVSTHSRPKAAAIYNCSC